MRIDEKPPGDDHERLIAFEHPESGLQGVLVVHSTRLGPAFGGIRRHRYDDEAAMVADARALARTMSLKCALAGLPAGGAKAVIQDHPDLRLEAAYRAIGELVAQLDGRWVCGPDLGTGDRELAWVRQTTRHVNPEGNDAAGMTARGVIAGLRGLLRFLDDDDGDFAGHSFFVQGLGAVGHQVANTLLGAGADVHGADPDPARVRAARDSGVSIVAPEEWVDTRADVLVPCALGALIDRDTSRRLRMRAICGSANNPVTGQAAEQELNRRGVVLVPDLVVNAGAVAEGVLTVQKGTTTAVREEARRLIDGFEATTHAILERARDEKRLPGEVARVAAETRIQTGDTAFPDGPRPGETV